MTREASRIEQECVQKPKPRKMPLSCKDYMALICRLVFFKPAGTPKTEGCENIRFIYVHFSAWHFAGSDLLWAGIAIRLFQAMQMEFGKLLLAFYQVVQHDEEDEFKKKDEKNDSNVWKTRNDIICSFVLFFLVFPAVFLVLVYCFPTSEVKPEPRTNNTADETGDDTSDGGDAVETLFIGLLGFPAVAVLKFVFQMVKNLIFTQNANIKRSMDNERISKELGFMNEVRKEMWFLSRFIQFMEVFERRRIRVVLEITNLDRCAPKKIVAILEAIDILLSDEKSPFLSILAANPSVLLRKVNFADGCFCREDRAYALLNRIVTLAFTVPPMSEEFKHDLFNSLTHRPGVPEEQSLERGTQRSDTSMELALVEVEKTKLLDYEDKEMEESVLKILRSSEKKLNKYMLDDSVSMKRIINSVWVTQIIMNFLNKKLSNAENITAWVVLANRWPCRFSWIIQCVEDDNQGATIDGRQKIVVESQKTLWDVFSESREELYVMRADIEDLLEQDGDPELFEELLRDEDFEFDLKNLEVFQEASVNLDQSIKRELALIRGTSRLKGSGWMREIAPLPVTTLIKMSTDDICKEMENMKCDGKCIDVMRDNKINGCALVFGDVDELKALLKMTFGDWATFKLHFLSFPTRLQQTHKDTPLTPARSKNQLSKIPQHVSHHHATTSSLENI
ncbi:NTPase KAP family P-loop domain-containing protein 1 isoform X2 [Kryptolebias marmoratus]|nr:NTPase KAP family P-loop domain-containing protein 1 isoform X2 [Kryptolebias marmoratus]